MNIIYLAQLSPEIRFPPFDGPANHIRHIIAEWLKMGHHVRFIGGIDSEYWTTEDLQNFKKINQKKKSIYERAIRKIQSMTGAPYVNYFASKRFAESIRINSSNFHCLYERVSWMGYGGLLAAKKLRIPLILEFNGDPLHDLKSKGQVPNGVQLSTSIWIFRKILNSASLIIASGKGWKNNLTERWGVPSHKVRVVENGTPLIDLLKRHELSNFQETSSSTPINIAYLGGFFPWHGTITAVKSFSRLMEQEQNVHLFMIGAGSELEKTKALTRELGIERNVTFTGSLTPEEYAPILASCEIGLSPYCGWNEYSGLKLFDYKAAGLAVIASGENGQPDTLTHMQTGMIIPPCDEQALTDALIYLISNQACRKQMGQQARLEAETRHSWRHTAQNILFAIEETTGLPS